MGIKLQFMAWPAVGCNRRKFINGQLNLSDYDILEQVI